MSRHREPSSPHRIHDLRRTVTDAALPPIVLAGLMVGAGVSTMPLHAWAQSAPPSRIGEKHNYSIPPGSLDQVLNRFASASGMELSVDAALTRDKTSVGLNGSFTVDEGFAQLLRGHGLQTVRGRNGAYSLRATPEQPAGTSPRDVTTLPPVTVMAATDSPSDLPRTYAGGQVARGGRVGLLGNKSVMEAPFNMTSYTSQVVEDQQAASLGAVLANDPSVRMPWPSGSYTETLTMRGFPVSSLSYAVDGLYGVLPSGGGAGGGVITPTEMFERIEVLKGPSAMLNGMPPGGSIGGSINLVPKRADDTALTRLTTQYVSSSQFGEHLDVGRRFGEHREWGVRFNGSYRRGDTPVDDRSQHSGTAALGLDYRSERFRASADLGYIDQFTSAPERPVQIATGLVVPKAPDAASTRNQPWEYWKAHSSFGMFRAEFDITPNWTAYAAVGANQYRWDSLNGFLVLGKLGKTDPVGKATATVRRLPGYGNSNSEDIGLRGHFQTGPVRHELTLNASRFDSNYGTVSTNVTSFASNLYNPTFIAMPSAIGTNRTPKTSETGLSSIGVADTLMALDDRIQLTLGVRRQRVRNDNYDATTGASTSSYDESAPTVAAALLIKPWEQVSLYANYIEGLTQGPVAPFTSANAGEVFAPYKSKQHEVGAKADFGDFTATLSAFQIQQPNAQTDAQTNVYGLAGEQRNRGIELNVFGEVSRSVRLLGGVSRIDGKQLHAVVAANEGKTAVGVPKWLLNLGGEWDPAFAPGLTLSGRVLYTSSQYVDAANTQKIPSWKRFDVGARYAVVMGGKPVIWRLNIENLFNRNYWASSQNSLSIGAPRTVSVSATIDF